MKKTEARWYLEAKGEVHSTLETVFTTIKQDGEWGVSADEYHLSLYCAAEEPGVRGLGRRGYDYEPASVPYNVCRSAADTMTAKIGKHRPLPQALANNSDWKGRRKAKKLSQFIDGTFHRVRFFEELAPLLVRDPCITRYGACQVFEDGDEVCAERVHSWELFVDDWDAKYGKPRNLYRCRSMDRGVLIERYAKNRPGLQARIESAGRFSERIGGELEASHTVDRVDVVEAWHLPSGPKARDGRHVVIVQGATLVDETYEDDFFPIAILYFNAPVTGFHGQSLVEQLEGYQQEINMTSEKLSEQYYYSGVGIMTFDGSGVQANYLRNGITHIPCKPGMRPEVFQMDLVNEHLDRRPRQLTQDALNDAGLSQMSVQSEKPRGVQAAVALQTLDDIETERFIIFGRNWEAFCLEIARRMVACAKRIADRLGDYSVRVPMRSGFVEMSWKDVEIDGYELKVFPTSMLQHGPASQKENLWNFFNAGIVSREVFLRHLDLPDLQGEFELEMAPYLLTDEKLDYMLDTDPDEEDPDERYMPPEPYEELEWAKKRALMKRDRAKMDGAPEEVLELLERYIRDVDELVARSQPAPAPPAAPPPGGPGAGPMSMPPEPMGAQPPMMPEQGVALAP